MGDCRHCVVKGGTQLFSHQSWQPSILHIVGIFRTKCRACRKNATLTVLMLLLPRYVLEDAGPDALVLLDELGKGTEVSAGAALAAAFLEHLCTLSCKGIFAT